MNRYSGLCCSTEITANSTRFSLAVLDHLAENEPIVPVLDREGSRTVGHTVHFYKFGSTMLTCEFELTSTSSNLISGLKLMAYKIVPSCRVKKYHMENEVTVIDEIELDHMFLTMFAADAKITPLERKDT